MKVEIIRIDELIFLSNRYTDFSCKPTCKKYKNGTVLDEDKSVKWNREEVVKRNLLYDDEVKRLNRKKNRMYTELVNLIQKYIIQETNVSDKTSTKIWNYLYEEYHSYGLTECINHLDDLLELFIDD